MTATYTINTAKNGIEIRFDSKPAADVLDAIKAAGYRWSRAQRLWWSKQSAQALAVAQSIAEGQAADTQLPAAPAFDLWEATRWTPGPGGDECHARFVGSNYKAGMSNREIAATVKKHLVQRFPGTKWSATTTGYNSVNVYLVSSPYENTKGCENMCEWEEKSPELAAILSYAENLLQSYNYDDSDSMTDYFDVNFYKSVGIAYNYKQTETTEAQAHETEVFRARMEEERQKEDERRALEWEQEQARRAEQAKEAARKEEKSHAIIAELTAAATVRTLDESEQYIIPHVPLARKAASLEEYREAVANLAVDIADCIVLEEITAPRELLEDFGNFALLYDVPELFRGIGGSRTRDPRVNSMTDYQHMSAAERDSVKWCTLAAAIYTTDGDLWAIVDYEGYNYTRYIAVAPWDGCDKREPIPQKAEQEQDAALTQKAAEIEDKSAEIIQNLGLADGSAWESSPDYANAMEPIMDSITKDIIRAVTVEPLKVWLYRRHAERAQIWEQLSRASIPTGERVTIIKMGELGGVTSIKAAWDSWELTSYAQYNKAAKIIVKPFKKRGLYSMTLYNNPCVMIVSGWLDVPEALLYEDCPTTTPGVTVKRSIFGSFDPAAVQKVAAWARQQGGRVWVDTTGDC